MTEQEFIDRVKKENSNIAWVHIAREGAGKSITFFGDRQTRIKVLQIYELQYLATEYLQQLSPEENYAYGISELYRYEPSRWDRDFLNDTFTLHFSWVIPQ